MRFETASGTKYELIDVESTDHGFIDAVIVRDGVPIIDMRDYSEMAEVVGARCLYADPPTIGQSFRYHVVTHGWVTSTPVTTIEPEGA